MLGYGFGDNGDLQMWWTSVLGLESADRKEADAVPIISMKLNGGMGGVGTYHDFHKDSELYYSPQ